MIIRDWSDWVNEDDGDCADVQVFVSPATRISELLGPDGEPLEVGYNRPKVGFDLTGRSNG